MSKVLDYMIRKYKIEWTINIEDIDKCVCFIHEPNDNCIRVNMFLNSFDQIEPMKEKALHHIKTGKMCEGRIHKYVLERNAHLPEHKRIKLDGCKCRSGTDCC